MERLWSPWRSQYIQTFGTEKEYSGCVFCDARDSGDDDNRYVIKRHTLCLTIMNLYPYNSGHILIVPNQHVGSFKELDEQSYAEMFMLIPKWTQVLDETMHPQGYNIGTNVGRTAGAGIDHHVHMHIVPRWNGDVNFMPAIGETKVISEALHDTMLKMRTTFNNLFH